MIGWRSQQLGSDFNMRKQMLCEGRWAVQPGQEKRTKYLSDISKKSDTEWKILSVGL